MHLSRDEKEKKMTEKCSTSQGLSGHYSRDWSECVNVISDQFVVAHAERNVNGGH